MKKCDLMVTWAGASTLSEIIALKVPSIIIPSPFVANNHQYINALDIVKKDAGTMIEEKDLKEGKEIVPSNYISPKKDYHNRISSFTLKISKSIEYIFDKALRKVLKYIAS